MTLTRAKTSGAAVADQNVLLEDDAVTNTSGNRSFRDVLAGYANRREVLEGGLKAGALGFFAASLPGLAGAETSAASTSTSRTSQLLGFEPVPVAEGNGPVPNISSDYDYQVLIPWGDPIEPDGPTYSYPPSAKDQAKQVGIGHDGMWFFPMQKTNGRGERFESNWHGMLCVNHEFGRTTHVLGKDVPESLADVRTMQHAHGVSCVEVRRREDAVWRVVQSDKARRIHVNTPVCFSGPVAGSPLLDTPNGNVPLGTVNNCANGYTPWGTYLTCEENFNGYFGATNEKSTWVPTEGQERYGFTDGGFGYEWFRFDRRFDLSDPDYVNEENRFGWIVEIDPMDASQVPVKRTALGRVKHEGIALTVGKDGRVVGYMGDDQRFDYIYKFVSDRNWRDMRAAGISPLDEGKLYVARFNEDGTGDWLELTIENPALAEKFSSQAEVLVYTRIAADILGATPMDRPEWTTVAPNQDVYCTLTNNSRRTEADAANPLAPNADGHIIRWRDTAFHTGLRFTWDIFIIAETTHGTEQSFADPDGLWADPDGRLFIQTDGGQKDGLNNQMLVADTVTGEIRRLFTGVTSDEVTGVAITPSRRTMFINLQHPGNGNPADTTFPANDGVSVPRDATIVITRKDGGIIGS